MLKQRFFFRVEKAAVSTRVFPSSRKRAEPVNWDKLEAEVKKEEKDEKLEGDAALNKLFQQIYANADEDMRRAMNKSYVRNDHSCFTVLHVARLHRSVHF